MAEAAPAAAAPRVSRLDRRKARTRQALIDAAVRLIAEGRGDRASIAEITEEADIGFGSFYNHFDSKEELFQTASQEVLERWGLLIDRASAGGMLGLLRMCQRHPERVTEATVDRLAEAELRLLGVPADEAARLAALPIPPAGAW
jgi:AcrR family transcriptional regulator